MKLSKAKLRKIIQETRWEDNPDPYGGAEGDLDMGWNNLIMAYSSAIWEAMELGLTPNEIKTAFEEAYDYVVQTYTPK